MLAEQEGHGCGRGPERRNMRVNKRARWALVIVAALALVLAATAAARTRSAAGKKPIVIGWVHDELDGADGAVRRARACRGEDRDRQGQQEGRRRPQDRHPAATRSSDGNATSTACAAKLISRGRKHHVHDLRREPRGSGRAGGSQSACSRSRRASAPTRWARSASVKWQARLQLRQRRAGRRVGDGPGRLGSRLEDGGPRHRQRDRLLPGRRDRLQGTVHAARRQDQLRDDVSGSPVRRQQRRERRDRGQRSQVRRRRHRHRGRLRLARAVPHRDADGGEQHAGPQLVGR